jgi:arabinogalactan endo-1,4-beta-galactosidase
MNDLKMNIPHASEARRAIEKGQYEKAQKQAAEVETQINDAVAKGGKSISGTGYLEPAVKAKLSELGYKCDGGTQYNQDWWSVSWA